MIESITVITLLLCALNRLHLQAIFDRDPYECAPPCAARCPPAQSASGLSDDPHGETAGADPDPHRTSRSAKGTGWDGGSQYLV